VEFYSSAMEIESGNGRFNDMFWFKKLTYFVRCFPHIINIAVKTGLKYATTIPLNDAGVMPEISQKHLKVLPVTMTGNIGRLFKAM